MAKSRVAKSKTRKVSDKAVPNIPDRAARGGNPKVDVDRRGSRYYRIRPKQFFATRDGMFCLTHDGCLYEMSGGNDGGGRMWIRVTDRAKDSLGIRPVEDDGEDE